ncbi:XRE family transcriptional regulator [Pseudomonas sp. 148P]|uniref:XRE family transcriptional regulator n=1 Tax=Pseudomonas ulcerans TaxID=3115852 RepID=A0ABU7HRF5_9PSED|nr:MULTISPECIES: XRE family transcriptional regulator [unclassified Pseudomonas]MEE1923155.1 XRE family transcriptional regulator [Pseudomonas sp. 147P]MEE1934117.1 XRE family transcriptional regulator [Pseudomonas sp. 148P]
MSKTLDEVMSSLPPDFRAEVEEYGHELIREEMTIQALRRELGLTQEGLAEQMDIRQATVSKVEKRNDMLISTLRNYVEALGGRLELVANMPGRGRVTLDGFSSQRECVE